MVERRTVERKMVEKRGQKIWMWWTIGLNSIQKSVMLQPGNGFTNYNSSAEPLYTDESCPYIDRQFS